MTALTQHEVLFSWALSEALSPRWQQVMAAAASEGLRDKLSRQATEGYSPAEQEELIAALRKRRDYLIAEYIDSARGFERIRVPVKLLPMTPVLPDIGWQPYPVTLGQFMEGAHAPDAATDPRVAARAQLGTAMPYPGYPIISYSKKLGCEVLLDGYTRCIAAILLDRAGEAVDDMEMIYCERPA